MGSAQQSRVIFVEKNLANLNGGQNQQREFIGLRHVENIYLQISDNRQQQFLKFAKDLNIVKESISNQQLIYEDNFDEIFNLDDNLLKEKLQNDYKIKQSEVYIILDERAKFIQSAKRHDDKQFVIKDVSQQKQDLNKENKTILFLGEKQTGVTSFANCFLNCLKRVELRSRQRYQLKDSMYYNFPINEQDDYYKYQMIDFPGIDNEEDLDKQLIKLHETIHEFNINTVCFIAQNDDNNSQMFQKKVLKYFNKKDNDKIFMIRTFSDFGSIQIRNELQFKQFQSQSTSFFLESLKNPVNMVNMKKTMSSIKDLIAQIKLINENVDTNIIKQTIILNKTLKYIDEQQLLCQELLKIIEKLLKQYERSAANSEQNGAIFKDFYTYRSEMEFAVKPIEKLLIDDEKIVECNQCKLSCTKKGEKLTNISLSITFINYTTCKECDCNFNVHCLSDQNIIKYKRPVQIQEIDVVKKSQYDHYSNQAERNKLSHEVLKQFFQNMVNNYSLILFLEKQAAQQKLQQNLFSEQVVIKQQKLEFIKINQIECKINQDLKIFIDHQISQINQYREYQLKYETRDLECNFNLDIQLAKFKDKILNIENYI